MFLSCLLGLASLAGIARAATTYPALFTYGDSFVDSNSVLGLWKASSFSSPPSPPNARVSSNGATWPHFLAQSMGLNCPYANFTTDAGVQCDFWRSYAVGGACSRAWKLDPRTNFSCETEYPSQAFYPFQVETHNNASINATLNREGLHIISIGSNDVLMWSYQTEAQVVANMALTRLAIKQGVQALYDGGARHFYLVNMEAITMTPMFRELLGPADRAAAAAFLLDYVQAYHNDVVLPLRASLPEATITEINLMGCYYEMNANCTFKQLGYTNWTGACIKDGSNPSSPRCSNSDKYVWWDSMHHTTAWHKVLANLFQDVINGKSGACLLTQCMGDTAADCPGGVDDCAYDTNTPNAAPGGAMSMWAVVGAAVVAAVALTVGL